MNLIAIVINHHNACVELREALHLNADEAVQFIGKIKNKIFTEGFVLSTCNRTEIYGFPAAPSISGGDVEKALIEFKGVEAHHDNFNFYQGSEALAHLFSVISGIDSMIVGDNQIYHQVKDAMLLTEENGFSGFLMKRIFDTALRTGKRAINETLINEGAVTISFAAVQLIEKIFSGLSKKNALVIGAGETGEIAAKHLRERGIGSLSITNRTIERGEKLALKLGADIIPFDGFKNRLHEFDIILSATSSKDFILNADDIKSAMKKRGYSPMVLMDIAIPRDIDPNSKKIDYVFYHDIDSLNIIVEQNLQKRKAEIPKVKEIIDEEVKAFISWYGSLEAGPTIKNLRDLFEQVRAEEVEKNINRFSEDDREKLEIITKRIINKLLHHPTVELKKIVELNGSKSDDAAEKINIIRNIFGMDKPKE
ncbi:MAG TPA: glutamyl-tRNA reductase [Ignavibacteriaceae bacterium]|nr:glutamyl-tRNA reductase [Ignavibacteriaceae bacterium]